MGYKKIVLREGGLIVEKYFGTVEFDDIINNDIDIYTDQVPKGTPLLTFTDVSQARFTNITYEMIRNLFQVIDDKSDISNGLRNALYTGNMEMEDFKKVHFYLEQAAKKAISMVPFTFKDLAFDWLNLSEEEKKTINEFLTIC